MVNKSSTLRISKQKKDGLIKAQFVLLAVPGVQFIVTQAAAYWLEIDVWYMIKFINIWDTWIVIIANVVELFN